MPLDPDKYRRSEIDWRRLNAYARRVARETSKPTDVRDVTKRGRRPKHERKSRFFGLSSTSHTVIELYDETEHIKTDYWVLDRRYHSETTLHQRGPAGFDRLIETDYIEYCLASDGALFRHSWEELQAWKRLGPGKAPINDHHTHPLSARQSLSEQDVMLFDYWPQVSSSKDDNVKYEADYAFHPGLRLRYHEKGVGLSKSLGQLLK
jgi:hypothetical protein